MMNPIYSSGYQNPHKYVDGCLVNVDSNSKITISIGSARDYTNSLDIFVPDPIVLDPSKVGPNGIDKGELETNKFYAVYLISDLAGRNKSVGILSLNQDRPIYPAETTNIYNTHRLIGYIKTGVEGVDFPAAAPMKTIGEGRHRNCYYNMFNNNLQITTNISPYPDPVSLDLSEWVPAKEDAVIKLNCISFGNVSAVQYLLIAENDTNTPISNLIAPLSPSIDEDTDSFEALSTESAYSLVDGVPTLYVQATDGAIKASLYCRGFEFSI